MPRTIVVLGGALSGPTAAARARETDEHARIVLVTMDDRVSYAAAGIPYHLSGEVESIDALDRERAELFRTVYRIEVLTQTEAIGIDPVQKRVTVSHKRKRSELAYDTLIFALGAGMKPVTPAFEAANVSSLREHQDLEAISRILATKPAARIAVIGGGVHGISMVDGLVRRGAEVTLIERTPALLPEFGAQVTRFAHETLASRARVIIGATITRARIAKGRITALVLSKGDQVATDYVVVAAGIAPRTELLGRAGAHLAPDGSVYVTNRAETSLADVYACGICVSVPHVVSGAHVWSAQGSVADKTAQVAGANAAGGRARLARATASVLKRVLDTTIGRTGLSESQARAHVGANFDMTTIHAPSHDAYFPGSSSVLVQLFWDKVSGRVLGCEAAGCAGVDKRIDVAACAIAGGLTVEELATIDFGYAPPYGSQRDPLNVAATVAAAERDGLFRGITPEELTPRLPHVRLVDVRPIAEHASGHVPGAVSVPLETLRDGLAALPRDASIVVYCGTGRRGYLASRILVQAGYNDVRNLEGGLRSWELMEQPIAAARKPAPRRGDRKETKTS
jgi:NADPH-dependent 2,4-dienoyl-CoA reductase/sulfur reductase-like enzyme/rhodanese-related sulfurtransferase